MKLNPDQYRVLAQVKRGPAGGVFMELLGKMMDDADVTMRRATGEHVGWRQGEAQFLELLLKQFEESDAQSATKQT